eukprot:147499-Rhodomonas_salina.1
MWGRYVSSCRPTTQPNQQMTTQPNRQLTTRPMCSRLTERLAGACCARLASVSPNGDWPAELGDSGEDPFCCCWAISEGSGPQESGAAPAVGG